MNLTISGIVRNKEQLEKAARFFASVLMDPRLVRNLNIDIEVSKSLDVMGECVDEDDTRNPRWFTIGLKKQNIEEMIKTLAHEMVHVKQHAKNELQSGVMVATKGGLKMTNRWMGKIWKPKVREDHYYDSPWEIIAYGMEVGLYQKWLTRKDPKKKWYVGADA